MTEISYDLKKKKARIMKYTVGLLANCQQYNSVAFLKKKTVCFVTFLWEKETIYTFLIVDNFIKF